MKIKQMRRKTAFIISFFLISSSLAILPISFYSPSYGEPPFSTNQEVNSGPDANRVKPSLAVGSDGTVYAAWGDWRNGNWDVYFTKSTDYGDSWVTPDVQVNSGPGNQSYPSIAVDSSGNLYAVWEDDRNGDLDIYFANSSNGGLSWSNPDVRVSTDTVSVGTFNRTQSKPKITVDSTGTLYVVWQDDRWTDDDIFFATSTDSGATFTNPNIRVNQDSAPSPDQKKPTMAVDSSNIIYVAWQQGSGLDYDIFLTKSLDGGGNWSDPHFKVNSDSGSAIRENPSLDVDSDGNIYCAWGDKRNGDLDIFFAGSFDGGITWTNPNIRVDNSTSGDQSYPDLAVSDSGTIYVAWHDNRNTHHDIYFAYSINKGANWLKPDINVLDNTAGTQQYPSIAVGPIGPVHVVWKDNRNDPNDIYAAYVDPIHPYPIADQIKVEGYLRGTPGIWHITSHVPEFSFTYVDPNSANLSKYNISVWNENDSSLLWFCNMTDTQPSESEVSVIYNTAPCPENGPQLVDGTTYKLKVAVSNVTGIWGPEFEVEFHLNEVLTPISPVTPGDNMLLNASSNQTVSWSSPGADSEGDFPTSCNWEVASDSQFTDIIESGSGLVFQSDAFDTRPWGTFYWRVSISDGWETGSFGNQPDGYWDFTTFSDDGSNNPPTITNKDEVPTSAFVNGSISFEFTASDPDNDTLSWSKISGAAWLQIGSENGTIYGMPLLENIDANPFTIQVSDGRGGIDDHTFTITVNTETNGNGDGDEQEDDDPILIVCWILLFLVIIILIILFYIIIKKRSKDKEEKKMDNMEDEEMETREEGGEEEQENTLEDAEDLEDEKGESDMEDSEEEGDKEED